MVGDNITLHTLDLNFHKEPEARLVQVGILADVLGPGLESIEPKTAEDPERTTNLNRTCCTQFR